MQYHLLVPVLVLQGQDVYRDSPIVFTFVALQLSKNATTRIMNHWSTFPSFAFLFSSADGRRSSTQAATEKRTTEEKSVQASAAESSLRTLYLHRFRIGHAAVVHYNLGFKASCGLPVGYPWEHILPRTDFFEILNILERSGTAIQFFGFLQQQMTKEFHSKVLRACNQRY